MKRGYGFLICMVADHSAAIAELQGQLVPIQERMETIQALADTENRDLTPAELTEFEANQKKYAAVQAKIKRRKMLADNAAELETPEPRVSAGMQRPTVTGGTPLVTTDPKMGFKNIGDFALAVKASATPGGRMDPRIVAALPTNYGNEANPADGGFAVPPDFRPMIVGHVFSQESLLSRTDQQQTATDTITFPKDETTPWTGGIAVNWTAEAGDITTSKPALGLETIRLHKLAALCPITSELQRNAPALSSYLSTRVPQKITYAINDALINGNGVARPLGILSSGCEIEVAKESAQTAATVNYLNVLKMWNRRYAPLSNNLVWLINQDVEPQLQQMAMPSSTVVPAYLPPGGFSATPYATLFGRPVITIENCQALGTVGDIILVDFSQYTSLVAAGEGVRQDLSIHMWFNYDINAFRFITQVGGQPWWAAPITPPNSANTRSPIVSLATRA